MVRNWKDVTCKNCLRHAPKPTAIAACQVDFDKKHKAYTFQPTHTLHYDVGVNVPVMRATGWANKDGQLFADAPNIRVTLLKACKTP